MIMMNNNNNNNNGSSRTDNDNIIIVLGVLLPTELADYNNKKIKKDIFYVYIIY